MNTNRLKMISSELKKNISIIFNTKIEDKRLKSIIITDVSVDKTLSYAKIYFIYSHALDNNNNKHIDEKIALLNRANHFIRKNIIKIMSIKTLPTFIYLYDKSIYQALKIINLIINLY